MYSHVKQRRILGVKRPDDEIANDPGVFGVIAMHRVGNHLRMQICDQGNQSIEARLLPVLWEPVCVGWGGDVMIWRGWQKAGEGSDKGQAVYLQEWRVTLVGSGPPVDGAAVAWVRRR